MDSTSANRHGAPSPAYIGADGLSYSEQELAILLRAETDDRPTSSPTYQQQECVHPPQAPSLAQSVPPSPQHQSASVNPRTLPKTSRKRGRTIDSQTLPETLRKKGRPQGSTNKPKVVEPKVPRARGRPPNSKNKTSRGAHNEYVPGPEGDAKMLELLEQQERLQQQEPTPIAFPAVYTRPPVPFDNNNYVAHPTPATFPAVYTGPPVPVDNNTYMAHPLALTSSMPEDFMTPMPVLGTPPASSPHTILYPHGQPVDAYGYLPTPKTSRHPSNGSIYDSDSGHGNGSIPPDNDHPGESSYVAAFPSFPHPDDLERELTLFSAPISSAPALAPAYALAPVPAPAPAYASAPAPTFMNSRPTQPQPLFIDPALINVGQQQPTPPPATSAPQDADRVNWDTSWDKFDFSDFDASKVSTYYFQSEF